MDIYDIEIVQETTTRQLRKLRVNAVNEKAAKKYAEAFSIDVENLTSDELTELIRNPDPVLEQVTCDRDITNPPITTDKSIEIKVVASYS